MKRTLVRYYLEWLVPGNCRNENRYGGQAYLESKNDTDVIPEAREKWRELTGRRNECARHSPRLFKIDELQDVIIE